MFLVFADTVVFRNYTKGPFQVIHVSGERYLPLVIVYVSAPPSVSLSISRPVTLSRLGLPGE